MQYLGKPYNNNYNMFFQPKHGSSDGRAGDKNSWKERSAVRILALDPMRLCFKYTA